VCVVAAAEGYPASPRRGDAISGVGEALGQSGVLLFQSGTAMNDGRLVTAGGRVLSVVGRGAALDEAAARAYSALEHIRFPGMQYRRDIGRGLG
jgi:phosphoribosylamine--glycine ligase